MTTTKHVHHYEKVGEPWRRERGARTPEEKRRKRHHSSTTFYEKPLLHTLLCHCGHVSVVQIRPY